jgi:hypothetical protein
VLTNLGISTSLEIWRMAVYILIIWLEDVFFWGGNFVEHFFVAGLFFIVSLFSLFASATLRSFTSCPKGSRSAKSCAKWRRLIRRKKRAKSLFRSEQRKRN